MSFIGFSSIKIKWFSFKSFSVLKDSADVNLLKVKIFCFKQRQKEFGGKKFQLCIVLKEHRQIFLFILNIMF